MDRFHLLTEQRLPDSMHLDTMSIEAAVALMHQQDQRAVEAAGAVQGQIAAAVRIVVDCLHRGGRLFYIGAGTSGRLGVLDASECPPTFRADPQMVLGIIAGGDVAIRRSVEGAEDSAQAGAAEMDERQVGGDDVVVGIAAGGTTPFVWGARARRELGARTVFLTCVQAVAGEPAADVTIRPLTGPEVVTGSTRLKAGTATKLVLNAISTIAMVQLGKVYENLMVDLCAATTSFATAPPGSSRRSRAWIEMVALGLLSRAGWPREGGHRDASPGRGSGGGGADPARFCGKLAQVDWRLSTFLKPPPSPSAPPACRPDNHGRSPAPPLHPARDPQSPPDPPSGPSALPAASASSPGRCRAARRRTPSIASAPHTRS